MRQIFLLSVSTVCSIVVFCAAFGLAFAIHEEIPAETQPPQQPSAIFRAAGSSAQDAYTLQALITLLEKNGVITRDALNEEIRRLKAESLKP